MTANKIYRQISWFVIFFCMLYTSSCNKKVQQVINISDNKDELMCVLNYYSNDKQKLEAAKFLIENMDGKMTIFNHDTAYTSVILDVIANTVDSTGWSSSISALNIKLKDYSINQSRDICRLDYNHITSDMLIANIDSAFAQWSRVPWGKEYSFSQFCEYVLPYRIFNEKLINWRKKALMQNVLDVDKINKDLNIFDIAVSMYDSFEIIYNYGMGHYGYSMNLDEINKTKKGNCTHIAAALAFYFRAYGIPSAVDCTPAWANRSSAHIWNAIIYPNGTSISTTYHPEGVNEIYYKLPKIYRICFKKYDCQISEENLENIPPFFKNMNMLDVTDKYDMPTTDVVVSDLSKNESKIVYLNVFNNTEWVAVAYATKKGNKATFKNMGMGLPVEGGSNKQIEYIDQGKGIVYLPTYYVNEQTVVAGDPFILTTKGEIVEIKPNLDVLETIKIKRKYPKNPEFRYAEQRLIGGVFEASNCVSFCSKDTLATISNVSTKHSFNIENDKKYKYIRFTPKENSMDTVGVQIAEISYSDEKGNKLAVTPLFSSAKYLYDSDVLTFYWHSINDDYAKFTSAFKYEQQISRIEIYAMNDDNDINEGQSYEVYYWNKGWKHILSSVSQSDFLIVEGVPKNALLYIRNAHKGTEQRIFTYSNGTQIWW